MTALTTIVALILAYFLAQALFRRTKLIGMLALFGLTPLAMTGYWIQANDFDPFLWIKIYSIMICVCWGSWLRLTLQKVPPFFLRAIPFLLAANVLEATIVDVFANSFAHRLNAFSGALLIATLPYGSKQTWIDVASKHRDLRLDISMNWIVGYTLWNWTFVYLNYPSLTGHHTAILVVALIVAFCDPQRWLQTRAVTLGLNLFWMATSYIGTLSVVDANGWFAQPIANGAAIVALSWMLVHLVARTEWVKPKGIQDVMHLADKVKLPIMSKEFVQSSVIQLEILATSHSLSESRRYH